MNKDQAKGRLDEVKGKIKEAAGKVVGNDKLELRGKVQNAAGKVQATFGDAKAEIRKHIPK
ncbi:MAG: CsbD-like protein [Proteobacteria bacterium]|nr:CsbD-like protein [Pseudomonadota bacterium]